MRLKVIIAHSCIDRFSPFKRSALGASIRGAVRRGGGGARALHGRCKGRAGGGRASCACQGGAKVRALAACSHRGARNRRGRIFFSCRRLVPASRPCSGARPFAWRCGRSACRPLPFACFLSCSPPGRCSRRSPRRSWRRRPGKHRLPGKTGKKTAGGPAPGRPAIASPSLSPATMTAPAKPI